MLQSWKPPDQPGILPHWNKSDWSAWLWWFHPIAFRTLSQHCRKLSTDYLLDGYVISKMKKTIYLLCAILCVKSYQRRFGEFVDNVLNGSCYIDFYLSHQWKHWTRSICSVLWLKASSSPSGRTKNPSEVKPETVTLREGEKLQPRYETISLVSSSAETQKLQKQTCFLLFFLSAACHPSTDTTLTLCLSTHFDL